MLRIVSHGEENRRWHLGYPCRCSPARKGPKDRGDTRTQASFYIALFWPITSHYLGLSQKQSAAALIVNIEHPPNLVSDWVRFLKPTPHLPSVCPRNPTLTQQVPVLSQRRAWDQCFTVIELLTRMKDVLTLYKHDMKLMNRET